MGAPTHHVGYGYAIDLDDDQDIENTLQVKLQAMVDSALVNDEIYMFAGCEEEGTERQFFIVLDWSHRHNQTAMPIVTPQSSQAKPMLLEFISKHDVDGVLDFLNADVHEGSKEPTWFVWSEADY